MAYGSAIKFYCEDHGKDFYVSRLPGRVECYTESEILRHDLGEFPAEEFWEYCCNCETAWRSGSPASHQSSTQCPRCPYSISVRYLCDQCGVFTLDSEDAVSERAYSVARGQSPVRRYRGKPDQQSCPGCLNAPLGEVQNHHCTETGTPFSSPRHECPFCSKPIAQLPSFPELAFVFLEKVPDQEKLTVAFDILDIENNLLVPSPDGDFLLVGNGDSNAGTIILPKLTSFTSKQDYDNCSSLYDCDKPDAGEVWVVSPAVVERQAGGWSLTERGRLEVIAAESPRNQAEASQPIPSETRPVRTLAAAASSKLATTTSPLQISRPLPQPTTRISHIAVRCPACNKLVEEDATFCEHCGANMMEDIASLPLTPAQAPPADTLTQQETYSPAPSQTVSTDAAASSGTTPRTSQITPFSQETEADPTAPTLTLFDSYVEDPTPRWRWRNSAMISGSLLMIIIAVVGAGAWYSWSHGSPAQQPPQPLASPAPSATPASRFADEEFKQLRQKRIRAKPSENSEIIAAFGDAEGKYPLDYRFPYERAKLSIKGTISDQEAFSALFLAAEKAIDSGKGQKMLDDLMVDKDGDFYKLSRGHQEWEVLVRALTNKDKSLFKGSAIK